MTRWGSQRDHRDDGQPGLGCLVGIALAVLLALAVLVALGPRLP